MEKKNSQSVHFSTLLCAFNLGVDNSVLFRPLVQHNRYITRHGHIAKARRMCIHFYLHIAVFGERERERKRKRENVLYSTCPYQSDKRPEAECKLNLIETEY